MAFSLYLRGKCNFSYKIYTPGYREGDGLNTISEEQDEEGGEDYSQHSAGRADVCQKDICPRIALLLPANAISPFKSYNVKNIF